MYRTQRDRPPVHELLVRAGGHPDDVEPHPRRLERGRIVARPRCTGRSASTTATATRPTATTSKAGPGRSAAGRTSPTSPAPTSPRRRRSPPSSRRSIGPHHPVGVTVKRRHPRVGRPRLPHGRRSGRPDASGPCRGSTSTGPMGGCAGSVSVPVPDPGRRSTRSTPAITSGSARSSGKACTWSSTTDPRHPIRWVACTPSSWPAAAGPGSTP